MIYKRGDILTIVAAGDYGKPRPGVLIQSDLFNHDPPSYTIALCTSEVIDAPIFRITILPTHMNNLEKISQVMIDKIITVKEDKVKSKIGVVSEREILEINRAIRTWLGL